MAGVLASLFAAILMMALCEPRAASQTAGPTPSASSGQIEPAAAFVAELANSIDSKKIRPGDAVTLRLTMDVLAHGQIAIPRDSRVVGHVTAAAARSRGQPESRVAIAFDHIVFKHGPDLPLHATIRAIGAPLHTAFPPTGASTDVDLPSPQSTRPNPGPNEMRAIYIHTTPGTRRPENASGPVEEPGALAKSVGRSLGPTSEGVIGIKGVELTSTADASSISSAHENFRLRSGTQVILRIPEPKLLLEALDRTRAH
jgi:hypothetical protein